MKFQLLKKTTLFLLLVLCYGMIYGQQRHQDHQVHFSNIDGFTGYVKFTTSAKASPTRVVAHDNPQLIITGFDATDEEIAVLNKAGLALKRHLGNYTPERYQFYVVGQAYIVTLADHLALEKSRLIINNGRGNYTTPSFNDLTKKRADEWNKQTGKIFWETYGGFDAQEVTELYLTDLKNEINQILGDYRNKNRVFDGRINSGTSNANAFNFEGAESALIEAREYSNASSEHQKKLSDLEELIATKKREKEESEEKEAEEKKKTDEEGTSGKTSDSSEENETDSESESDKGSSKKESSSSKKGNDKKYVPKTASQMHSELKAMASRHPELMNNPRFRQQLRYLEVDANREQQTLREYRSGVYSHGNYQAMASQIATNQRVDTYTKAVGDVTDAVQGLVGSILNESMRRSEERRLRIQGEINEYNAKRDALFAYHKDLERERSSYTNKIREELDAKYYYVWPTILAPVMIDTEVEDRDNAREFKRTKLRIGYVYAYVIVEEISEEDQLFGLAADNGSVIYPPQFEGIVEYEDDAGTVSYIVNIADKWGEIDPNGRIIEEIKYDGLWYTADGTKITSQDNQWTVVYKNGKKEEYTTNDLKGKQVVLSNLNRKDYSSANMFSSYLYILDFERGIYASHLHGDKELGRLLTYELNKAKSEYIDGKYRYHYAYLFKKEDTWYRADIHQYQTTTYTLTKVPDNFVVAVSDRYIEGKTGKKNWGAINQDNEVIIPFEHEYMKDFKDGIATSDKGAYNESGKLLFTGNYDSVSGFENGIAFFKYKNTKTSRTEVGLVNEDGSEIIRTNGDVWKGDDGWYALGMKFKDKNSNTHNLDGAIYCFSKIPETAPLYARANKIIGDLYYFEKVNYENALQVYEKSLNSARWTFYLKNMKRRYFSKNGKSQYQTEYFAEVTVYADMLHSMGWMHFRGQGTKASLIRAQDIFNYLIHTGNTIIDEFKYDSPPDRNKKPVDISNIYFQVGEAHEHLGDLKNAKKYYKLAAQRKNESVVKKVRTRLDAIKKRQHYKF